MDLESPLVLFAAEGKDAATLERFKTDLRPIMAPLPTYGRFAAICLLPILKGLEDHFSDAYLTFKKFHVMKILNEAVNEVRCQEQQDRS